MAKVVFILNIPNDLKNYLDNLNLNYEICITNMNESVYNNKTNEKCEISNELKKMLYSLYNDKELSLFLNNYDNEKKNLELSNNFINDMNIDDNFLIKYVDKLIYNRNENIK